MKNPICKSTTVTRARDQVSCNLNGDAVILNLKSGVYYGLSAVGAQVWNLIEEPKTIDTVLKALLDEYDVETDRCEADLFALLDDMASRDLLEVK